MFKKTIVLTVCLLFLLPLAMVSAEMSNFSRFEDGVSIDNMPVLNSYAGNVYWVDYNAGSDGNEGTFKRPWKTIDYAIGRCTASNGDIIMVKPGHSETIIVSGGMNMDVAGVSIIGLGEGELRPQILFSTVATASYSVSAANCSIKNVIFDETGIDGLRGLYVNAADFTLDSCKFVLADSDGQALTGVQMTTLANKAIVQSCEFTGTTNTGTAAAIGIEQDPYNIEIRNSTFLGDYSSAAIFNDGFGSGVPIGITIDGCVIRNYQTNDFCIELQGASTGIIMNNRCTSDQYTTVIDPGSCRMDGNTWFDSDAIASYDNSAEPFFDMTEKFVYRPAANLPATTTQNIFAISGGPVFVKGIWGVVGTVIESKATTIKLTMDPTTGADTDLCGTVDMNAAAAGSTVGLTNTFATAMDLSTDIGVSTADGLSFVLPVGTIDLTTGSTATGTMSWYIRYEPLMPGAHISAN